MLQKLKVKIYEAKYMDSEKEERMLSTTKMKMLRRTKG